MNIIQKNLQHIVLKTNSIKPFQQLNKLPYNIGLKIALKYLRNIPGLSGICLRGSMCTGQVIPGVSDIDLIFIIEQMTTSEEILFLKKFWNKYAILNHYLPFFQETEILDDKEWMRWCMKGDYTAYSMKSRANVVSGSIEIPDHTYIPDKFILDYLREAYYWYSKTISRLCSNPNSGQQGFANIISKLDFYTTNNPFDRITHGREKLVYQKNTDLNKFSKKDPHILLSENILKLDGLSEKTNSLVKKQVGEPKIILSKEDVKPQTLETVINEQKEISEMIYSDWKDMIKTVVLSSSGNRDYSYKIYYIIKDDIPPEEMAVFIRASLDAYQDKRVFDYFTHFKHPLFMTENMMISSYAFNKSPFESVYLKKHGIVLSGKNRLDKLKTDDNVLYSRVLTETLRMPSYIRTMLKYPRIHVKNKSNMNLRLIDTMTGEIASTRLLLDKGIVTTTVRETINEYISQYDDEYSRFLENESNNYIGQTISQLKAFDPELLFFENYPIVKTGLGYIECSVADRIS